MKTNTLTGADLNRAVAMALGLKPELIDGSHWPNKPTGALWAVKGIRHEKEWLPIPDYAGSIAVAWPIIKKHKIDLEFQKNGIWEGCTACMGRYGAGRGFVEETADDPQVAAMRCFVASVYGDDVELP